MQKKGIPADNFNGRRLKQSNPFGPNGVVMVSSEVVYDTPLYGKGTGVVLPSETSLFKNADRIGVGKVFLCNLGKAGELPFGSAREIFGISCHMNFRPQPGELNAALATAAECYDLFVNYTYIEIVKNGKSTVATIPMRLIPQFNGVTGTGGATGEAKYTAGKGILKLDERITIEAGETFEAVIKWGPTPEGMTSRLDRFNAAIEVEKCFTLNLHCIALDRPSVA